MPRNPFRRLAQVILSGCLIGALAVSGLNFWALSQSPAGAAFTERSAAGIQAATERALLREATPHNLTARIDALLAEVPRNWLAITAVETLAEERGIALPDDTLARRADAYAADHSLWSTGKKCARCAVDAASCDLSAILICRAPVDLTMIGDVAGLSRGGLAYLKGTEVDEVEVILSGIGLGAVAMTIPSGGSSLSFKAMAGFIRMARATNRMPDTLIRPVLQSLRHSATSLAQPAARQAPEVAALVRPGRDILDNLGQLVTRTSAVDGLHLLKYVDDPTDLGRMARASAALGPRTTGVIEVLGKSRFLRLTMRVADQVWYAATGMIAALAALLSLLQSVFTSTALRGLRRLT